MQRINLRSSHRRYLLLKRRPMSKRSGKLHSLHYGSVSSDSKGLADQRRLRSGARRRLHDSTAEAAEGTASVNGTRSISNVPCLEDKQFRKLSVEVIRACAGHAHHLGMRRAYELSGPAHQLDMRRAMEPMNSYYTKDILFRIKNRSNHISLETEKVIIMHTTNIKLHTTAAAELRKQTMRTQSAQIS